MSARAHHALLMAAGGGWRLDHAVYDGVSFTPTGLEDSDGIQGISFRPDGTRMFLEQVYGSGSRIYQLDLAVPWLITSASYSAGNYFSTAGQMGPGNGIAFSPDGLHFYGSNNASTLFQFDLSTAWDIRSATYSGKSVNVGSSSNPQNLRFRPDGGRLIISRYASNSVVAVDLPTPWDLGGAAVAGSPLTTSSPTCLEMRSDGLRMWVARYDTSNSLNRYITEFSLSAPWDLSAAVAGTTFSYAAQISQAQCSFVRPDGEKMWLTGDARVIYQYSVG